MQNQINIEDLEEAMLKMSEEERLQWAFDNNIFKTIENPAYGFHCNPAKCCLLVHPSNAKHTEEVFADSAIPIRSDGAEVLGSPIGSKEFTDELIVKRVRN
ncbi:hypothetical protein GJ496_002192 [Pomphorhynchus laevis]|nr:hypothetical protein GJ496_002192 [Pomphorhynchus laevis]